MQCSFIPLMMSDVSLYCVYWPGILLSVTEFVLAVSMWCHWVCYCCIVSPAFNVNLLYYISGIHKQFVSVQCWVSEGYIYIYFFVIPQNNNSCSQRAMSADELIIYFLYRVFINFRSSRYFVEFIENSCFFPVRHN